MLAAIAPFMGKKGSYAIGSNYVPQTGLYQLHAGERVIPKHHVNGMGQLVATVTGDQLNFVMSEYNRKRGSTY